MKITELVGGRLASIKEDPYQILDDFSIWTTNEEKEILKKLTKPVKLAQLSEQDQFRIQAMIRKSLITKIGMNNPSVVANEQKKNKA
jgi:hypothetical protein